MVCDYKGKIIQNGEVILNFDKQWSFAKTIVNGTTKFSKTYLLAEQ